ncbi:nucleotidyltransferase domain-containing protein [Dyella marensis]
MRQFNYSRPIYTAFTDPIVSNGSPRYTRQDVDRLLEILRSKETSLEGCRAPGGGNGGSPNFLTPNQARRIQNAADRIGKPINVVGSRANGTAGPNSDWDYVIDANAPTRNSVSKSLPGTGNLSEGTRPNLDVFKGQVNPGPLI